MEAQSKKTFWCILLLCLHFARECKAVSAISFDNLTSYSVAPLERDEIISDLRRALNDNSSNIEKNMAIRYPELLSLAAQAIDHTRIFIVLNETEICSNVRSLLLKTSDRCQSAENDVASPCHWRHWRDELLLFMKENLSTICIPVKKNVTKRKPFVPRGKVPVTMYLLAAMKILTKTVILNYERRCKEIGGTFQHGSICSFSTQHATPWFDNLTSEAAKDELEYSLGLSGTDSKALFTMSLTGNIASSLCLILLIVTYIALKKHKTVPGKNTMCLSASLIAANVIQIAVAFYSGTKTFCIIAGVFLHWSFLAAFFWMSALAYDYFITFHRIQLTSDATKTARYRAYCITSFTVPTVAVVVCLAVDIPHGKITQYGIDEKCFIVSFWTNLFAFIVPIAILLAVNITLLILTIRDVRLLQRSTQQLATALNRKQVVLTMLAMKIAVIVGVAWLMAFVDAIVSHLVVKYIYTAIVTFQGVLIYLAFGCFELTWQLVKEKVSFRSEVTVRPVTKETNM